MVSPTLWGPVTWQVLFACTWHCKKRQFSKLQKLVHCVNRLLPCAKCRDHVIQNQARVTRRAKGVPDEPMKMFYWLYCLKDEVNKHLKQHSLPFSELTDRFVYHGALVDDVRVADILLAFAAVAVELGREEEYVDLCVLLAHLLPLPSDSELVERLTKVSADTIFEDTLRIARAARVERGFPPQNEAHYRAMLRE